MLDEYYMKLAIKEAEKARKIDEAPIGCVIVRDDCVIARGHNTRETKRNPLNHAELHAIGKASKKLDSWRLEGCTLYVTLEPCPMCAGAIIQSRINRVVFGAYDYKAGSICSKTNLFEPGLYNHDVQWQGGVLEEECSTLLSNFFAELRKRKK